MEDNGKDKKKYEVSFLVKSEDDIPGIVSFLGQHNAEDLTEPRAKNVALAYEIKGNKEAVFAYCHFAAAGEDAKNLERDFTMRHDVIRSLIVSLPSSAPRTKTVQENAPAKRAKIQRPVTPYAEVKLSSPRTLSNEALEKKIEEILG